MSYNPKHALVRAVRSLPRWARAAFIASLGASMAAGIGLAAAGGSASVSGTTVTTTNGEAGYVTFGGRFQYVQATDFLRAYTQEQSTPVGAQLCDPSSGDAVQVGAIPDSNAEAVSLGANPTDGGWTVAWAYGNLSGASTNGCAGDGLLNQNVQVLATGVPSGDTFQFKISYARHGGGANFISVEARNLTVNTSGTDYTPHAVSTTMAFEADQWPQFRTAGVGVMENPTSLSAPVVNKLAAFSKVDVRTYSGVWGDFGDNWWTAEQVVSVDGQGGSTVLVSPENSLSGTSFSVFGGSATSGGTAALGSRSIIGD